MCAFRASSAPQGPDGEWAACVVFVSPPLSGGGWGLLRCDVMKSCSGAWLHLLRPCARQPTVRRTVGVVDKHRGERRRGHVTEGGWRRLGAVTVGYNCH